MGNLENLWLEMLSYEPFPHEPQGKAVLICQDRTLALLLRSAAISVQQRWSRWDITVKEKLEDAEGDFLDLTGLDSLNIYGMSEEVVAEFPSWESYRDFLREDKRESICAGDFICQAFIKLTEERNEREPLAFCSRITLEDGSYMAWKAVHRPESFFYFDNTYDGQLKDLQKIQMECLDEIDRICRKHKIHYFLAGGTLLGAIRHRDVIPWDDDIDVMMLREDYERFDSVVDKELGKDYFYQSCRTDPWYHSPFAKMRRRNTLFMTEYSRQFPQMNQGIFVDIFVHDRTASGHCGQKLHVFATLLARSLVFHKWEGTDMHFYGKWKSLCRLMTWFKNHSSMNLLERIQRRTITWFQKKDTGYLYDGMGDHLRRGAFPARYLESGRTGWLGEREYPIPADAEGYLQFLYGEDYMRMPAPQKRKATHPIVRWSLPDEKS